MVKKNRKIHGVGINDADYCVNKTYLDEDGKQVMLWRCPYYVVWKHMLGRGYCKKTKIKCHTYEQTTVCKEWHSFMQFKVWVELQEYLYGIDFKSGAYKLDKDILCKGNKEYAPTKCCLVTLSVNNLLLGSEKSRGECPIGVSKRKNTYTSYVRKESRLIYLGRFSNPILAHKAWQIAKKNIILKVAEQQVKAVKEALLERCIQLQYDIDNSLETIKL